MTENHTEQSNNSVARDLAGRDINYNFSTHHNGESKATINVLTNLLKKYKEDCESNLKLVTFIDELDYYYQRIEGDVAGLEKKLLNGNQGAVINFALRAKERFYKKLLRTQFSESAQKINAHLLGLIEMRFSHLVYPQILNGCAPEDAINLVQSMLLDPLLQELTEDTLGYTPTEISGMLYYLTGNCHIKWTK